MHRVLLGISIDAVGVARLPEVLVEAGCKVTVVCGPGLAITSSRYVTEHIQTGRSLQAVRQGIEEHIAEHPDRYSWVIIADEPLLRTFLVPTEVPELARLAPLTADPLRLACILSKVRFSQDAEKAGIPIPRFRVLAGPEDRPRQTWRGIPSVAKAEESLSGSGIRVIHSAEELATVNETMTARPMLFQECKQGRVGATAVLYDAGVPRCWFSYFLCNNWPTPLAAASAFEIFAHPEIERTLAKLGLMTGFHGLCGLDWVLDENTGDPLILEMNPRPTPGLYMSRLAGVDFARAIRDWLNKKNAIQRPSGQSSGLHRLFPQNLYRATDDRNPVEFFRTWADAPFADPKLLLSQIRRFATHYLPRSWRDKWKLATNRS